ncbi:FG-GAP repeat domain-containing protein [Bremerella sp. P1]|uniref:FG-GAP repeat domain-containing protein n=1 Tax=Bremerella sp. P1 TaxID=3026424 RepID=UPI0023687D4D|nr:VCBS repeat-containing protein [Bremerella sp. P1]WDI44407.1 VCBS repeat-containing protein [Bremerella sp. P1]
MPPTTCWVSLLLIAFACATLRAEETSAIRFQKIVLSDRYFCDGIQSGDINQDGATDIVAGPYWYAGPSFDQKHEFYPAVPLPPEKSPSNSMFSFVHDFSGDGLPDILVLGRVHLHAAYWYENPGSTDGEWKKHYAFERVQGESPALVDLFQDGNVQVVCHWEGRLGWIEPQPGKPQQPWRFQPISDRGEWKEFYHGEGVGDVNGDGRLDLVINDGWFEQPPKRNTVWPFHTHKFAERGGAQIYCDDVDEDGDADVITALDGHGWGLAWFEQTKSGEEICFEKHLIMGDDTQRETFGVAFTQLHALDLADINGDLRKDIIVGTRRWAHGPKGDIEPMAAPVVYWFERTKNADGTVRFVPHQIDDHSGVGVQIQAADVNGDGRMDVLTSSKLGSFVFVQDVEGAQ